MAWIVLAAGLTGGIAVAGPDGSVPVSIKGAKAAVDIVLMTAMDSGKVLTTTDDKGKGTLDPLSLAMDSGKLDVIQEKCGEGKERVLLVDPDLTYALVAKKDGCRRKRLGAFLWGKDPRLDVNLSGGPNLLLIGGGVLLGGGGAILVGGGSGGPTSSGPGPSSSGPTSTPGPSGGTVTTLCGNFSGRVSPTQVGCGFTTSFDSVTELTCSSDGIARVVVRRADDDPQGQRFEYTGRINANGTFEFTGSGSLRGFAPYNGRLTGTVSGDGRTMTAVNTVTFTTSDCNRETLVQSVTGTR